MPLDPWSRTRLAAPALVVLALALAVALAGCRGSGSAADPASATGDASFVMAVTSGGLAGQPLPVGHVFIRVHGAPDRGGTYDRWIEADPGAGGTFRVTLFRVPAGTYAVHGRGYAAGRGTVDPANPAEAPPEFATALDAPLRIDPGAAPGVSLVLQQTVAPTSDQNVAPVVTALVASALYLDSSSTPADRLALSAAATDANGTAMTFALTARYDPPVGPGAPGLFTPAGGTFPASGLAATWDPPGGYAGTVTISLAVSDGFATSSVSLRVDVRPGNGRGTLGVVASLNQWPDVRHVTVTQAQLTPGTSTPVAVDAIDPDGDPLSYEWRNDCGGSFLDGNLAAAIFTAPASAGTCRLSAVVRDGRGGVNDTSWVDVLVKAPPSTHAPDFAVVAQTPTAPVNDGHVQFYVLAEDPATGAPLPQDALAPSDHGAGGTFTALGFLAGAGAYGWRWDPPLACPNPNPVATTLRYQVTFLATLANADPALVTSAEFTFNVGMGCGVR
jgi:hypothetical protein